MAARKTVRGQSWDPSEINYSLVADEDVKEPNKQTCHQISRDEQGWYCLRLFTGRQYWSVRYGVAFFESSGDCLTVKRFQMMCNVQHQFYEAVN